MLGERKSSVSWDPGFRAGDTRHVVPTLRLHLLSHSTHSEVTRNELFLIRDLLQISKRGTVTGGAGTWAAYICRLRWRDRPLWLVPRGHCTWIVKHQTTWAEDQGSQVLMSKTHEVYSLQNGFNNKNRIVGGCAMRFLTTEERS